MPRTRCDPTEADADRQPVSVVIPCRNEAPHIEACLRSLLRQSRAPAEILLVDDGSTDESGRIAARLAAASPVPLRILSGPTRGAAAARNFGAGEARGRLLVFCEGDATYSREYLQGAAAAIEEPGAIAAIGGLRRVWADRPSRAARAWDAIFRWRWERQRDGRSAALGAWVFRRADFLAWGGYDESLTVGEDRDLALRAGSGGGRIAFFPHGEVHHRDPVSVRSIWSRFFWGGRHSRPFRRRWGHPTRDLAFAIALLLLPLLLIGLSAASPRLWPAPLAALILLPMLARDPRGGMAVAARRRDPVAALAVPAVFFWAKLASAVGLLTGWLSPPAAAPGHPRPGSDRAARRRVDFLAWRPVSNATARCRGAAYRPYLWARGWELRFRSPVPVTLYHALNDRRGIAGFAGKLAYAFLLPGFRLVQILAARRADLVILQRELHPLGPPLLERLLARLQPRLLYDVDDAIDLPPPHLRRVSYRFHDWGKPARIARLCRRLLVASPELAARMREFGPPIAILPTPVDTARIRPARERPPRAVPTLGWIGTAGNLHYLQQIAPALIALQERGACELVVVSDAPPRIPRLQADFFHWHPAREVRDLQRIDIGLMPLGETAYARAKSGHKILTYWAAALPVVASPVGVNAELVAEGLDGYLASSLSEWEAALTHLLRDAALRRRMGRAGYAKVTAHYAQSVLADRLVAILDETHRAEELAAPAAGRAPSAPAESGGI